MTLFRSIENQLIRPCVISSGVERRQFFLREWGTKTMSHFDWVYAERSRSTQCDIVFVCPLFVLILFQCTLWISQNNSANRKCSTIRTPVTTNPHYQGQGLALLSSVLNSDRAIEVNIRIIRIFIKLREMLFLNKDIRLKLEKLEHKIRQHYDNQKKMIFK